MESSIMRLNKITVAAGVATLALIGSSAAFAGAYTPPPMGHFYVGAGVNYSANSCADYKFGSDSISNPGQSFQSLNWVSFKTTLDNNVGFNVLAGYQFNHTWGLEAFFDYYGDQEYNNIRGHAQTQDAAGNITSQTFTGGKLKINSTYLVGLVGTGVITLNEWLDLFGKLGAAYYSACAKFTIMSDTLNQQLVNTNWSSATFKADWSGVALVYGVGLQMNFGPSISARLEYDGYETSDNNVARFVIPNQIALNILYRFV